MRTKITLLYLAAEPLHLSHLRLGEEIREVKQAIRLAPKGSSFRIESEFAVRPRDLVQSLLQYRPQIVHFSGHAGNDGGIILEDDDGKPKPAPRRQLENLLRRCSDHVRLIVMNACYSERQQAGLASMIDYVVGTTSALQDRAAIRFSASFYHALACDSSVYSAVELAKSQLGMEGLADTAIYTLSVRPGIDPSQPFLSGGLRKVMPTTKRSIPRDVASSQKPSPPRKHRTPSKHAARAPENREEEEKQNEEVSVKNSPHSRMRSTEGLVPVGTTTNTVTAGDRLKVGSSTRFLGSANAREYEYDVFLSYATVDGERANEIFEVIQSAGGKAFLAEKSLKAGDDFADEIRRAIRMAKELWLIVSPTSLKSEWVISEWGAAWALGMRIVPILYRCRPEEVPDRIRKLQCIDFHEHRNLVLERWPKDRGARRRPDRVRSAVAVVITKLDRWKALQLSVFQALQSVFVEASEMLTRDFNIVATRDYVWKSINDHRTRIAAEILKERIESAYVGLFPHFPAIRERFISTLDELDAAEDQILGSFLEATQGDVMALKERRREYTTAMLGNALRTSADTHRDLLQHTASEIMKPLRAFLLGIVSKPDQKS